MTVFKWAENSSHQTWTMLLLLLLEVRVNTGAGRPQQVLLMLLPLVSILHTSTDDSTRRCTWLPLFLGNNWCASANSDQETGEFPW